MMWLDDFNMDKSLYKWKECAWTGNESDGTPKP